MANPLRRLYDRVLYWAETPCGTPAMAVTNVCNMEPGLSCRNLRAADAAVAGLPYLRDFLTTCCYYLVGAEDR